jgi:hypothetical protein
MLTGGAWFENMHGTSWIGSGRSWMCDHAAITALDVNRLVDLWNSKLGIERSILAVLNISSA